MELTALQEWGSRHVMGDGSLTATPDDAQTRRVRSLVGSRLPGLDLPDQDGRLIAL
jgi:hypothetical protein